MATDAQDMVRNTDHALLVGLGLFGHQIGLFDALDKVRFPGRVYKRAPQRKLPELLAALAAGYQQLQEINLAANPIRADPVVIAAWDPQGFAHYTRISRGLRRADATTVRPQSSIGSCLDAVSGARCRRISGRWRSVAFGRGYHRSGDHGSVAGR